MKNCPVSHTYFRPCMWHQEKVNRQGKDIEHSRQLELPKISKQPKNCLTKSSLFIIGGGGWLQPPYPHKFHTWLHTTSLKLTQKFSAERWNFPRSRLVPGNITRQQCTPCHWRSGILARGHGAKWRVPLQQHGVFYIIWLGCIGNSCSQSRNLSSDQKMTFKFLLISVIFLSF